MKKTLGVLAAALFLASADAFAQAAQVLWQGTEPGPGPQETWVHTLEQGPQTGDYALMRWDTVMSQARGFPEVLEQTAFVADHVIVRVKAGKTQADLAAVAAAHAASIRRRIGTTRFYLVAFPVASNASSQNAAPQMVATLAAQTAVVESAAIDELRLVDPQEKIQ